MHTPGVTIELLRRGHVFVAVLGLAAGACRERGSEGPGVAEGPKTEAKAAPAVEAATPEKAQQAVQVPAALGQLAPDFTLPDVDGKSVKLSDFKGKTVVLEWFNPGCPFVRASHTKGSLVGTADRHQKNGVVWLAINSGAPGKQGAGRETNLQAKKEFGLSHPLLLDESGAVGKLYGAKTTPHMYVIAPDGKLVYRGGIDNSPDGEGESPQDGKLVKYVDEALAAIGAGNPVANQDTEPYGCSVKYAM